MKNKMIKILGVVLTVALLSGLIMTAVPVSAGSLSWTDFTPPQTKYFQLTQGTSANIMAVTPDGKTIFVFSNNDYATNSEDVTEEQNDLKLYKSVDAGLTWTTTNIGDGLEAFVDADDATVAAINVTGLTISYDYASDRTIYAAAGDKIWRSRNGGTSFTEWGDFDDVTAGAIGAIKSIDTAEYYRYSGNAAVLVAGTTGVALYDDYTGNFEVLSTEAYAFLGSSVLGAAFSPNYRNDGEILAVTTDATDTFLETKFAASDWNVTVRVSVFLKTGGNLTTDQITDATTAVFAFPSDYSYTSNNKVYVGLGGLDEEGIAAGGPFDVYRVNGTTKISDTPNKATNLELSDTDSDSNIAGLAYKGTASTGSLVVSFWGTDSIYSTTNVSSSSPDWTSADAPPTGQNAALKFIGDTLYAGTANVDGFGSVFASSADKNLFAGISLISVPSLADTTIAKYLPTQNNPNQWVIYNVKSGIDDPSAYQLFFKSTDAGKTWKLIYVYSVSGKQINVSNVAFAGADTIYLQETGPATPWSYTATFPEDLLIKKSTNGGFTWDDITPTIDGTMSSMAIAGDTIWVGSTDGGVYKNGSYDKVDDLDGRIPWVMIAIPGFFMVYTLAEGPNGADPPPGASDVYVSTDNGATFDLLGDNDQFTGLFSWTFNVPNKTIYAANKSGDNNATIYQWKVGTTTSWDDIVDLSALDGFNAGISGLALAGGGGTLYVSTKNSLVTDTDAETTASSQIWRAVSFSDQSKDEDFQAVTSTTYGNLEGMINSGPMVVATDSSGNNILTPIITLANISTSSSGVASDIKSFTDNLAPPVVITAPAANAQTPPMVTLSWNAVSSTKTIHYQWQVATDDKFQGIAYESGKGDNGTTATSAIVDGLINGQQYYFRVRVSDPLFSAWSTTVPFIVKLAAFNSQDILAEGKVAPVPGAANVSATPSFQWAAISGAQSYKFQLADNAAFTTPIVDTTTNAAFYADTTPLTAGKAYFWRVAAVAGTNVSDWATSTFTVGQPVATGPVGGTTTVTATIPPITVPTPSVTVTVQGGGGTETPAPGTPAYIWVIIAIGAVLVIAVIVLIARTRRV